MLSPSEPRPTTRLPLYPGRPRSERRALVVPSHPTTVGLDAQSDTSPGKGSGKPASLRLAINFENHSIPTTDRSPTRVLPRNDLTQKFYRRSGKYMMRRDVRIVEITVS